MWATGRDEGTRCIKTRHDEILHKSFIHEFQSRIYTLQISCAMTAMRRPLSYLHFTFELLIKRSGIFSFNARVAWGYNRKEQKMGSLARGVIENPPVTEDLWLILVLGEDFCSLIIRLVSLFFLFGDGLAYKARPVEYTAVVSGNTAVTRFVSPEKSPACYWR